MSSNLRIPQLIQKDKDARTCSGGARARRQIVEKGRTPGGRDVSGRAGDDEGDDEDGRFTEGAAVESGMNGIVVARERRLELMTEVVAERGGGDVRVTEGTGASWKREMMTADKASHFTVTV